MSKIKKFLSKWSSSLALLFTSLAAILTGALVTWLLATYSSEKSIEAERINDLKKYQEMAITLDSLKNEDIIESFKTITFSIRDSKIKDRDALYSVYKTLFSNQYDSFSVFLEKYYVWLITTDNIKTGTGDTLTHYEIVNIEDFISEISQKEDEDLVFEGISSDDKLSILTIKKISRDSISNMTVRNELYKLSYSLKDKERRLKKEGIINRAALLISLLSLLATVLYSKSTNSKLEKLLSELT